MTEYVKLRSDHTTLLTLHELAAAAGVSKKTLQRQVRAGRLPAVRVGNQLRVRLSDWLAYLETQRVAPESTLTTQTARIGKRLRLARSTDT